MARTVMGASTQRLVVLAVLALSAFFRFAALSQVQLKGDQTEVLGLAQAALERRQLPAHSMASSVGITEQPLEVWLCMPAVALAPDHLQTPAVAAFLWASLDIIVVALLFRLGRDAASPGAGLLAAAAYGSNFWAILFARRVEGDSLMPFFATVALAGWWRFTRGSSWALLWAIPATSLLLETHPAAAFLSPLPIVGLLLGRQHLRALPLGAGLLLGVLPWLPYLLWHAQNGFKELTVLASLARSTPTFDATSLRQLELLTSLSRFMPFLGKPVGQLYIEPVWAPWVQHIWHFWLAAAVARLAVLAVQTWTHRGSTAPYEARLWWLATTAAFAPALLLVRHAWDVHVHYVLGSLPALFLLVGLTFARYLGWLQMLRSSVLQRMGLIAAGALTIVPLFHQGVTMVRFYQWQEQAVTQFHGLPLKWWREFIAAAAPRASLTERPVLAYADEHDAGPLHYVSFGRFPLRLLDPQALVLPSSGPVVMMGVNERSLAARWFSATDETARVPWPGNRDAGWAMLLTDVQLQALRREISESPFPWRVAGLMEFDVRPQERTLRPGEHLPVQIRWHVLSPPSPAADYRFFLHLVDRHRMSRSGLTVAPVPLSDWRAGEVGLALFALPIPEGLPPGGYGLLAGLYDARLGRRLPLIGVQGPVPDSAAHRGPLKVPLRPTAATLFTSDRHAAAFDARIALAGLQWRQLPTGDQRLRLQWRALAPISEDLTRFVHLVDDQGRIRWQDDAPPRQGTYPTSIWDPGELIEEELFVSAPDPLQPSWRLRLGWYRWPEVQRLPRTDDDADPALPDALELPLSSLLAR